VCGACVVRAGGSKWDWFWPLVAIDLLAAFVICASLAYQLEARLHGFRDRIQFGLAGLLLFISALCALLAVTTSGAALLDGISIPLDEDWRFYGVQLSLAPWFVQLPLVVGVACAVVTGLQLIVRGVKFVDEAGST
jgi:hypothetical protein